MSLFNKGFSFNPVRTLFNKGVGAGRSFFNKGLGASRQLSSALGQGSRFLADVSREGDKALSSPEVNKLARQLGAGGLLGSARGLTGGASTGSSLLGAASLATNPATYSGQSPVSAASSAIERARSLGGQTKKLFM